MGGLSGDHLLLRSYYPSIKAGNLLFYDDTVIQSGLVIQPQDYTVLIPPPNIFDVLPTISFNTTKSVVTITYPVGQECIHFANATFNGLTFGLGVSDPSIYAAVITQTNIPGLTQGRVSFDNHDFNINMEGLTLPTGQQGQVQLSLGFGPPYFEYNGAGRPVFWAHAPGGTTTVHVYSSLPPDLQLYLEPAEAEWTLASGGKVQFDNVANVSEADITIGATKFPLNTPNFVLGETFFTGTSLSGALGHVQIGLEDPKALPLVTSPTTGDQWTGFPDTVLQVLTHELGHAIGLGHNLGDPHSVMSAHGDGTGTNTTADAVDKAALQALYGGQNIARLPSGPPTLFPIS